MLNLINAECANMRIEKHQCLLIQILTGLMLKFIFSY